MNKSELDVLKYLFLNKYINQRLLADKFNFSLGKVNNIIKNLMQENYLDKELEVTEKTKKLISNNCPKSAVILAAGYGMRTIPINSETPKGLINVKGEVLIERIIRQLRQCKIKKIYIVVGFMKEKYEYLIDKYDVELIVNMDYSHKNNLHSLMLASKFISNSYIIPCDIWCEDNPFDTIELYSWYMVTDDISPKNNVRVNRKHEIVIDGKNMGNKMIGISYLTGECSEYVKRQLLKLDKDSRYDNSFWEEALIENNKMMAWAKIENTAKVYEFDTYEQVRNVDSNSNSLNTESLELIKKIFNVTNEKIKNISALKKGMTNCSFVFQINDKRYIMRIPGKGTDQLINRRDEAKVYSIIKGKNICENIVYIDSEKGYKITEFLDNSRVCNAEDYDDLVLCINKLKYLHSLNLEVNHRFDIFEMIEFYESLWGGEKSIYNDYEVTKQNVFSLKSYIEKYKNREVLTHIDAVPDNFLITENGVYLIDWEYAGMQDPHVDIAMFCIYSLYSKKQIDELIDIYFDGKCDCKIRIKIYCYIAACGLLWSNWCEYKQQLGIEFGEYSLKQYRYAKDYYKIVVEKLEK